MFNIRPYGYFRPVGFDRLVKIFGRPVFIVSAVRIRPYGPNSICGLESKIVYSPITSYAFSCRIVDILGSSFLILQHRYHIMQARTERRFTFSRVSSAIIGSLKGKQL